MISQQSFLQDLLKLPRFSILLSSALAALAAASCTIGLMGTAAWLISSAALQPPLATLTLAITAVRAFGIGRAVFRSWNATFPISWPSTASPNCNYSSTTGQLLPSPCAKD